MSWSMGYNSKDDFEKDQPTHTTSGLSAEAQAQVTTARGVAKQLIEAGSIGDEAKDFTVSLSGHANPGHEPTPGWANDCITVSITQKSPS